MAADLWLISTSSDPTVSVSWLVHRAAGFQDQVDRRLGRGKADPVEVLALLIERFDTLAIPALDRWANPGLLANDLEDLEVPFRHGKLLLGLDLPTGSARQMTIRRLRGHEPLLR